MPYILLNAPNSILAKKTAHVIKSDLLGNFNREVIIVNDFMSVTVKGLKMLEQVQDRTTSPARALALILTQRKALMEQVVLPAMESGKGVIYIGGVLDDLRYAKVTRFQDILRETQELLQSIGGHAYPVGAVYVKDPRQSLTTTRDYFQKAERLRDSMAGLKLIDYSRSLSDLSVINDLFN